MERYFPFQPIGIKKVVFPRRSFDCSGKFPFERTFLLHFNRPEPEIFGEMESGPGYFYWKIERLLMLS